LDRPISEGVPDISSYAIPCSIKGAWPSSVCGYRLTLVGEALYHPQGWGSAAPFIHFKMRDRYDRPFHLEKNRMEKKIRFPEDSRLLCLDQLIPLHAQHDPVIGDAIDLIGHRIAIRGEGPQTVDFDEAVM
jgi:hypothetical protein